jgi:mannose-6-phosphate isomerase
LKPGADRSALARVIQEGRCDRCLHHFQPQPGDCVFLPAGTVHALGEGLLVAEIQQASDTTYRLFDWNRLGSDGMPRPLHVEEGLEAIDYDRGPVAPAKPRPTAQPGVSRLVDCDKFILDRRELDAPQTAGESDRCRILSILGGSLRIEADPTVSALTHGQTVLLPACLGPVRLVPEPKALVLEAYLP